VSKGRVGWSLPEWLAWAMSPLWGDMGDLSLHSSEMVQAREREVNRQNKSINKYCLLHLSSFASGRKNQNNIPKSFVVLPV